MVTRQPIGDAPALDALITFEQFLSAYDGQHAEWLPDGSVDVRVSNNIDHANILTWLLNLFSLYFGFTRIGRVIPAGFVMRATLDSAGREPDLLIVLAAHYSRIQKTFLDGPADIAIEIVSPESVERDYVRKFSEYEAGGVAEYWLIDPQRHSALLYELQPTDGAPAYVQRPLTARGEITSPRLPGFMLDAANLWKRELPEGADLLRLAAAMTGVTITITPDS